MQRVESLAERTNRLAGKATRKALQNYTSCVARNIDQLVPVLPEARVRNSDGSGQPPEPVADRRLTELCGVAPAYTCQASHPSCGWTNSSTI